MPDWRFNEGAGQQVNARQWIYLRDPDGVRDKRHPWATVNCVDRALSIVAGLLAWPSWVGEGHFGFSHRGKWIHLLVSVEPLDGDDVTGESTQTVHQWCLPDRRSVGSAERRRGARRTDQPVRGRQYEVAVYAEVLSRLPPWFNARPAMRVAHLHVTHFPGERGETDEFLVTEIEINPEPNQTSVTSGD